MWAKFLCETFPETHYDTLPTAWAESNDWQETSRKMIYLVSVWGPGNPILSPIGYWTQITHPAILGQLQQTVDIKCI